MKNKKFTYLLLTSVLALWGIIFYKIFNSMAEEDSPIQNYSNPKSAYFKMVNHQNDTLQLNFDYSNPFDENRAVFVPEVKESKDPVKPVIPVSIAIKPPVKWNAVQYAGYINNPLNKKKVALLRFDGKEFMLSEGEQANGIKLLKYSNDSIKVQFQNETKYIKLN